MRILYIPLFFLIFLLLSACHPVEEPLVPKQEDTRPITRISGKVVLPVGTTISLGNLTVLSSFDTSAVTSAKYSLDVVGKFSTLFATDDAGDIILMGYNYPGQEEYDITPRSTAITLLMTSPTMQSLTEEGRVNAVRRLTKDAHFQLLVSEIEGTLLAGKSITDATNTRMLSMIAEMFRIVSVEQGRTGVDRPKPIVVSRSGKIVSLRNNRVAHDYVAGLYKDGIKQGNSIIIKGTPMFASSVYEALKGFFFQGYSEPDQQLIELKGDGQFAIRIRSGTFDMDDPHLDLSSERREARDLNGSDYFLNLMLEHVPIPKGCLDEIRKSLFAIPGYAAIMDDIFRSTSLEQFNISMLTFMVKAFEGTSALIKNCTSIQKGKTDVMNLFFKGLGKYLKFLSLDSKVAAACNVAAHQFDLYNSNPTIDTCFQVSGKVVSNCDCLPQTHPLVQSLTSGGSQEWILTRYQEETFNLGFSDPCNIISEPDPFILIFRTDNTLTRVKSVDIGLIESDSPCHFKMTEFEYVREPYCLTRSGKFIELQNQPDHSSYYGRLFDNVRMVDRNTLIVEEHGVKTRSIFTYTKR